MNLHSIFSPLSIAVVGASSQEKSVGNDVVKNLVQQGYKGKIFPVNPKIDSLYGLQVFHDLNDIQEQVDLMIVAVPAQIVPQVLDQAGQKKIPGAIVLSAGFKEVGNHELEAQIKEIAVRHDMALIGPNCLGVINPFLNMNASFAPEMPVAGNIAFISQSGALCTSALDYAVAFRMGFSKFLSTGNKAVIDEVELFNFLQNDPETKVIAVYVEQLSDAQKFIQATQSLIHASPPKPIVMLKSGRSEEGAKAVASHTGSLSTQDKVYDALLKQAGVIRAQTVRELFEYADMFSRNLLVSVKKIAIITNAGGPGVLATDEAVKNGLTLSKLSEETQTALKTFLPPAANVYNPVDMLGAALAKDYQRAIDIVEKDPEVEGILVILTPQSMTEIEQTAQIIADFKQRSQKPIVASFMGQQTVFPGILKMEAAKVNTTAFPELAARCLSTLGNFIDTSQQPIGTVPTFTISEREKIQHIFTTFKNQNLNKVPSEYINAILNAYQIPTVPAQVVRSAEDAKSFAQTLGKKVVLKIVSPDIEHKSDAGGVKLNVQPDQIDQAYEEMLNTVLQKQPQAKIDGVLVAEMLEQNGLEMIVGAKKVPELGTVVLAGLGGIYVEIFQDVQMGFAPLTEEYARTMVGSLSSAKLLQGARGHAGYDQEAFVQIILKISQLVTDFPEIIELDLNPVTVFEQGKGVKVLDARILLEARG